MLTEAEFADVSAPRRRGWPASTIAFLERLLQVEVEAAEARRLAGPPDGWRFASLPAAWTLEESDFDA